MELLNELPEEKRKAVADYIARERDIAFANGLEVGRSQSLKETIATFIRGSIKSKNINVGLLLTIVGVAGEFQTEIEQFLRENARPSWAAGLGLLWIVLRYITSESVVDKGKK